MTKKINQGEELSPSKNLAGSVLRQLNKKEAEVKSTEQMDTADDMTEGIYAKEHQTAGSPIFKACMDGKVSLDSFRSPGLAPSAVRDKLIQDVLQILRKHKGTSDNDQTLYASNGKVREEVLQELGTTGYWGMLIPKQYGGLGLSMSDFVEIASTVSSAGFAEISGLSSVHGCIGAVDPLLHFGNEEQKREFLPKLASGELLSAFALTEPMAGSDLTNIKTRAILDGDNYLITGEKLFITNATFGRLIALVALVGEGESAKPQVFIAQLPKEEDESFRFKTYDICAVRRLYNQGMVFTNFKVPKENMIKAPRNNGLIIVYHGLNKGRLALLVNSIGIDSTLIKSLDPWGKFRKTYGEPIEKREIVLNRYGKATSNLTAKLAVARWVAHLLDQGHRGELEGIVAKVFGSETTKDLAIDIVMKTHGGRSFLKGHIFADNIFDFLAPCIYEGEGDMLTMAFFKSLAKQHGMTFMAPIGEALEKHKLLKTFNPANPIHAFKLRRELFNYSAWYAIKRLTVRKREKIKGMNRKLQKHVSFAQKLFPQFAFELSHAMIIHQQKLADRQMVIVEISQRIMEATILLVTALYAHDSGDPVLINAADVICTKLRRKLEAGQTPISIVKACCQLGKSLANGEFAPVQKALELPILERYID
jgi:alkylation response protein AidB-like acyl-CoA dehydrogenase